MSLYIVGADEPTLIIAKTKREAALKYTRERLEASKPLALLTTVSDGEKTWYLLTENLIIEVETERAHECTAQMLRNIGDEY